MDRPARNAILGGILDFGLAAVSPPRGHPEIAALELHSVLGTTEFGGTLLLCYVPSMIGILRAYMLSFLTC